MAISFKIQSDSVTDAEIQGENKTFAKTERYFSTGLYEDCTLRAINFEPKDPEQSVNGCFMSPCKKDPTWISVGVGIAHGDKVTNHFIMVPTEKLTYGDDAITMPFLGLCKFMNAIGIADFDRKTASKYLQLFFTDPSKLFGLKVNVKMGYRNAHVQYISKGKYHVLNAKEEPVAKNTDGTPQVFNDMDSACAFMEQTMPQVKMQRFVEVVEILAPKTKNDLSKPAATEKKVAKKFDF